MNNIQEFVPSIHAAIITKTGGGKTTLASKIFGNMNYRAIYVDWQSEKILDRHLWIRDSSRLSEAMRKSKKVVLRTNDINQIRIITEYIFDQKKKLPDFAKVDIFIFYDEIQKYSQLQIIEDVFNMGRKWKIHGIAICRQIQEMKNLRIISECDEIIFLRLNDVGIVKLKQNYDIRIPEVVLKKINSGKRDESGKLQSDYNSALYDGFTWFLFNKEGEFIGRYDPLEDDQENVDNQITDNREMSESETGENDNESSKMSDS